MLQNGRKKVTSSSGTEQLGISEALTKDRLLGLSQDSAANLTDEKGSAGEGNRMSEGGWA